MIHKQKPVVVMSKGYVVQRWTGKSWYNSMCSPYKTMSEVRKHLDEYYWHYTEENPYRIIDFKPKTKIQKYVPKYDKKRWNSDDNMVICNSIQHEYRGRTKMV